MNFTWLCLSFDSNFVHQAGKNSACNLVPGTFTDKNTGAIFLVGTLQPASQVHRVTHRGVIKPGITANISNQSIFGGSATNIAIKTGTDQVRDDLAIVWNAANRAVGEENAARDLELQEKLLKEKLKRMEELNRKMAERLDGFKKEHETKINKHKKGDFREKGGSEIRCREI